jgi:hypothetical protein
LQVQILDLVSEELFVKVMNGERIIDDEDAEGTCSRVVSGRTGSKGKAICRALLPLFFCFSIFFFPANIRAPAFNHHRNGLPYVAKVEPLTCTAKMHIYCPWESLHPELARMAIVIPLPESGHSHPPPPKNKCTHAIADKYRECVRKFGPGASVNKVENGASSNFVFLHVLNVCSAIDERPAEWQDTQPIPSRADQPRHEDSHYSGGKGGVE